jgi:2-polyprenyl-3-methyl-5-hydroxy-6-metoxy-1,4-benzoquinol methylase
MSAMSTDEPRDHHGNPADLNEYIARLDNPTRDEWQRPDVVLNALGIAPTSVVCDVGAGTGYFALRLAKLAAQVYAVDVEPLLLSLLRDRVASAGLHNVTPVLGLPHDPLIPSAACDLILVVNVFHHVPDKAAYLRRLQAALRPGGRLAHHRFPQARAACGSACGPQALPRGLPGAGPRGGIAGGNRA